MPPSIWPRHVVALGLASCCCHQLPCGDSLTQFELWTVLRPCYVNAAAAASSYSSSSVHCVFVVFLVFNWYRLHWSSTLTALSIHFTQVCILLSFFLKFMLAELILALSVGRPTFSTSGRHRVSNGRQCPWFSFTNIRRRIKQITSSLLSCSVLSDCLLCNKRCEVLISYWHNFGDFLEQFGWGWPMRWCGLTID